MTETPKYLVIRKENEIEIRHYPACIQAEVTIDGKQYRSAIEKGFIMPSAYTLETLPQPKDSRVQIRLIPNRSLAAIRFSGYFRQNTIEKNKQRLSQWLQQQGFEKDGDFIVAGYIPPWVPGFLARNEVLIQVKKEQI